MDGVTVTPSDEGRLAGRLAVAPEDSPGGDADDDIDFSFFMPISAALKTSVEVMSHTLLDATFKIEHAGSLDADNAVDPTNLVLRVDALESGHVCACKVRITCRGHIDRPDQSDFCIRLKPFLEILRSLPNEGVQISRKSGSSDIELKTLGCEAHRYRIHTLEDPYDNEPLEICDTDFSLDFDLTKLKAHLRVVTSLKADVIRIQIFQLPDEHIIFRISCDSQDASGEWNFFSSPGGGQVGFLPEECASDSGDEVYDEIFSTEHLKNFTKSMERNSITLSLTKNDPKVLIIEYSLGVENSSIIFLLAPKVRD